MRYLVALLVLISMTIWGSSTTAASQDKVGRKDSAPDPTPQDTLYASEAILNPTVVITTSRGSEELLASEQDCSVTVGSVELAEVVVFAPT